MVANETDVPKTESKPLPKSDNSIPEISTLSPKKVADLERRVRMKEVEHEMHLKDDAFLLLLICIIGSFVLYFVDTAVTAAGLNSSDSLTILFDLIKTVITLLLGYLFSEKNRKS